MLNFNKAVIKYKSFSQDNIVSNPTSFYYLLNLTSLKVYITACTLIQWNINRYFTALFLFYDFLLQVSLLCSYGT